jgi:polar amino acid transport system substrate-binding protein
MRYVLKTGLIVVLSLLSLFVQAGEGQRNFQEILDSGELRVGLSMFTPWTMHAKSGDPIGSEVDVAYRLANDMNLAAKLKVYEWDKLIAALNAGEIDVVVAGMAVTPERALKVNFSQPYASAGIGLVANSALTENFKSIEDMRHKTVSVGAVSGTVSEKMAKRLFAKSTIQLFSTQQDAEAAVLKGDIHAYVASNPAPSFLALRYPDKVDTPLDKPLYSTREAFAVRKGDQDMVNFLNAWIVARSADSWLQSTRSYWFESLDWRELAK